MAQNIQAARSPRLNPFAFPSDTDFRFVLLIVSVLGSSLFIFQVLAVIAPFLRQQVQASLRCDVAFQAINPTNYVDIFAYRDALLAAQNVYIQCNASYLRLLSAWLIVGVTLVLVVAVVLYWIFPSWKLWRDKLVPLSSEDAPEVVAYLADLCHETALTSPPQFVWNPLNLTSSALAFGRFKRYYVALSGGLVTQFYTDQPAFRAIMLHELAHLRNADINKTYFTVAIWRAFVIVALLPFAVSLIYLGSFPFAFNLGWRILALTVLVYLTRNSVLRAREYYADVRATIWDGATGSLDRVLKALQRPRGGWQRIMQPLHVHPDPDRRSQILAEPHRLFRMGFWEAFGVGIAVEVAFPNIQTLTGRLTLLVGTQRIAGLVVEILVPALIFATLVVGVLGLGTWRATFAAMTRGEASSGAGRIGFGLGLGFIAGMFLSLGNAIDVPNSAGTFNQFVYNLPWNVLLLVSMVFFFRWIAAGASAWLEIAASRRSPRLIYIVGLAIASGVLAVWLVYIIGFSDLSRTELQQSTSLSTVLSDLANLLFFDTLQQPITFLVLISLWAFPLAAWFWRGRVAAAVGSSWAFMDSSSQRVTLPHQEPFRPLRAMLIGVGGGLLYCALLLLIRILLPLVIPEAIRNMDQVQQMLGIGRLVLAGLLGAVIAAIAAGWVKRLGLIHGLFAAFFGGWVMTEGILFFIVLSGGTIDFLTIWTILCFVINGGALLVLPTALGVSALAEWIRHVLREDAKHDVTTSSTA